MYALILVTMYCEVISLHVQLLRYRRASSDHDFWSSELLLISPLNDLNVHTEAEDGVELLS